MIHSALIIPCLAAQLQEKKRNKAASLGESRPFLFYFIREISTHHKNYMYKTIRFEIALCTHTKDKAQKKKSKGEHRRRKWRRSVCVLFLGGVCFLGYGSKGLEVLCLFALLPELASLQGTVTIMAILMIMTETAITCTHIWIVHIWDDARPIYINQHGVWVKALSTIWEMLV